MKVCRCNYDYSILQVRKLGLYRGFLINLGKFNKWQLTARISTFAVWCLILCLWEDHYFSRLYFHSFMSLNPTDSRLVDLGWNFRIYILRATLGDCFLMVLESDFYISCHGKQNFNWMLKKVPDILVIPISGCKALDDLPRFMKPLQLCKQGW